MCQVVVSWCCWWPHTMFQFQKIIIHISYGAFSFVDAIIVIMCYRLCINILCVCVCVFFGDLLYTNNITQYPCAIWMALIFWPGCVFAHTHIRTCARLNFFANQHTQKCTRAIARSPTVECGSGKPGTRSVSMLISRLAIVLI